MEHYYSENPTSEKREEEVSVKFLGNGLRIVTVAGVFSVGKIDRATGLLIEKSILPDDGLVLDLGCGYGVVGIAVAKAKSNVHVLMSDLNSRAVEYASKNIFLNKVKKNCQVRKSNGFEKIPEKFNTILLNPPFNAGRDVCLKLIDGAYEHLKEDGMLEIVARHSKGGKYYMKYIEDKFGNVETVAKSGGFRVYISRKG